MDRSVGRRRFAAWVTAFAAGAGLAFQAAPAFANSVEGMASSVVSESTGAAMLSIPIAVPPGSGGFAPKLALTYSSRGGDGPYGVGWSLGLPEIRCSARFGVPDFSDCQHYELGDTLLVPGTSADRYHTIVESFQRIQHVGSGDGYWTVEQTDGTTLTFGQAPSHRITQNGGTARWLLERMHDPFANTIYFTYDLTTSEGEALPLAITYGDGAGPGSGPRQVLFSFEDRDDARLLFTGGVRHELTQRLEVIHVVSSGGTYRRYAFGYSLPGVSYTTARTRLSWVQELGGNCTPGDTPSTCRLPKRTFRYRDAGSAGQWVNDDDYRLPVGGYANASTAYAWTNGYPQLIGDLNGDGLPDRIELDPDNPIQPAKPHIYINTGSGFAREEESSDHGDIARQFQESFESLTYSKPYYEFIQIRVDPPTSYQWNDPSVGGPDVLGTFAMCSVTPKQRDATLSQELLERGVSADTSNIVNFNSNGATPGYFEPRPSVKLADLDADGLADLVVSLRLSGVKRHFDCESPSEPLENPDLFPERFVRVVFRNTGSEWVKDPLADQIAATLPPFEEVIAMSSYQTEAEDPDSWWSQIDWHHGGGDPSPRSPCAQRSLFGFEQLSEHPGYDPTIVTTICHTLIDLAPQFVDFNGDGNLDIAVLEREYPEKFWTGRVASASLPVQYQYNRARTRVWLQQPEGSLRWVRGEQYDLPSQIWPDASLHETGFAHMGLHHYADGFQIHPAWACWSGTTSFKRCGPNTNLHDMGVRFADLNRDGLPDVVWDPPGSVLQSGVFLNTGNSSSERYSAWCTAGVSNLPSAVGSCAEAPRYLPPAEIAVMHNLGRTLGTGHFADLNGDGFLDYISIRPPLLGAGNDQWLHDPGAAGASVWQWAPSFGFGIDWDFRRNLPVNPLTNPNSTGDPTPMFQTLDIDGNGVGDVVGDLDAFVYQSARSDLLSSIDNGRGGTITIEYAAMNHQRDAALETKAEAGDIHWADDAGPITLWRPSAVVSKVIVEGPNIEPPGDITEYDYAHPRFHRELRSDLGFGLVRRTRAGPAVSAVEEYFYQDVGRTGRMARRAVFDASALVHRYDASWVPAPANVPERGPETYLARIEEERSESFYSGGSLAGARTTRSFEYDDNYGFNFVGAIHVERPTSDTFQYFTPYPIQTGWIKGLVAEARVADQRFSGWVSESDFTYTAEGRLQSQTRYRWRGETGYSTEQDVTSYLYDGFGNVARRTDAMGRFTAFGYDPTGSVLTSRTDPAVTGQDAKVTQFEPHLVFLVPRMVTPGYRDVPITRVVLDDFGRTIETWLTPRTAEGPGTEVRVSETIYSDHALPTPIVEQVAYTSGSDYIRSALVDDGFGGVWKTIRDASPTAFMGSATWHFPAERRSRTTDDLPCEADELCGSVTGRTQGPAADSIFDVLGRPLTVVTARGTSRWQYDRAMESIVEGSSLDSHAVDVVWSQNARGDLTRRSYDGDRVVAVEECTNSNPARVDLDAEGCAAGNGPHRTLYGYHPSGPLEVVHDPIGVQSAFGDPRHELRYHFDTAGQVIGIDDPDAGSSEIVYDGVGNVISTLNARGQVRGTSYDALDRPTQIVAIEGANPLTTTFSYRPDELQLWHEDGPGYSEFWIYDGFGRVAKRNTSNLPVNESALFEYDLQGRVTAHTATGKVIQYEYAGAFLQRVCARTIDPVLCNAAEQEIITDVTYDLGRRKTITTPAGTRTYTYDDASGKRDLTGDSFAATLTPVTQTYGGHDELGNVGSWSVSGPASANGTFGYDARNRLASWSRNAAGQPPVPGSFQYDALGNLTVHDGVVQEFEHATKPHAVTQRGTKTFDWDESGNLARAGQRYFTFDSADRLVRVGTSVGGFQDLKVIYNAAGERLYEEADGGTTKRAFIGPNQVHTEGGGGFEEWRLDIVAFGERVAFTVNQEDGSAALEIFAFEVAPEWLAIVPLGALAFCLGLALRGGLLVGIARRPGHATVSGVVIVSLLVPYPALAGGGGGNLRLYRWVMSDRIGSGVAVFDDTGEVVQQTRYAPFGAVDDGEYAASATTDRRRYAGHAQQVETGLVYMNARWMDPETGTFLSVDPVVADYSDPQSYSGYSYARNSPVSFTDPTGKCILYSGCPPPPDVKVYYFSEAGFYSANGLLPPNSAVYDTLSARFESLAGSSGIIPGSGDLGSWDGDLGSSGNLSDAPTGVESFTVHGGGQSQSGSFQDTGGKPVSSLTEAEQAQAQKWAEQSRTEIVKIFDSNRAPAPRNWEIESITVSRTANPNDPLMRASNDIHTRISAGIDVQVGRITGVVPFAVELS